MSASFSRSTITAPALFSMIGVAFLCLFPPAAAPSPLERIALMLVGPSCRENRQAIESALTPVSNVRDVDFLAVPDHVLVDIETGTLTARVLRDTVNDVFAPHHACRAEIMKSCISADVRSASMKIP